MSASSSSSSSASSASSSPASSTLSGRMHAASLVDEALHSPDLLDLVDVKVTRQVIAHLVDRVSETVAAGLDVPQSAARGRSRARTSDKEAFADFAAAVIRRADVKMPVVLGTLVYIQRASRHLRIAIEEWAHHRVFLGALIVASKYLNDSSLKNAHWALCTGTFGKRDIGRIEREFLEVLDFELSVNEHDLMEHYDAIMETISHSPSSHRRRNHVTPVAIPSHAQHRTAYPYSPADSDASMSSPCSSMESASPLTPPPVAHAASYHQPKHTHHHSAGSLNMSSAETQELYESFPVAVAPTQPPQRCQQQKPVYLPFTKIPLRSVASFGAHPWATMAGVA